LRVGYRCLVQNLRAICVTEAFLQLESSTKARPYAYHLTDPVNLEHIRTTNEILPASLLMERAGRHDLLRSRRPGHERIAISNTTILVRDQVPLHKGNIRMLGSYSYEDLVENLNRRIFFGPVRQGVQSGTGTAILNAIAKRIRSFYV
jgi:hypothetical protein